MRTTPFTRYGTATIHGTIACTDAGSGAGIDLVLAQRVGRFVIRGYAFAELECSASPAPWSIDVQGNDGKFLGGHATVDAFAFACGPMECADDFTRASLRLRH